MGNTYNKIKNFFKKKPSELELLMINFFMGNGFDKFAEAQQKEMFKQKEIERNRMIKEKYDYLIWRKKEGLGITEEQAKEFDYLKFLSEKNQ